MPNVRVHSAFEPLTVSRRTPVFVLTGAGISAESGVRTFRDAGGLWHSYRFQDVASPEAWAKDPALVWKFYSERRAQLAGIKPNAAHRALAELERRLDSRFFLVHAKRRLVARARGLTPPAPYARRAPEKPL